MNFNQPHKLAIAVYIVSSSKVFTGFLVLDSGGIALIQVFVDCCYGYLQLAPGGLLS